MFGGEWIFAGCADALSCNTPGKVGTLDVVTGVVLTLALDAKLTIGTLYVGTVIFGALTFNTLFTGVTIDTSAWIRLALTIVTTFTCRTSILTRIRACTFFAELTRVALHTIAGVVDTDVAYAPFALGTTVRITTRVVAFAVFADLFVGAFNIGAGVGAFVFFAHRTGRTLDAIARFVGDASAVDTTLASGTFAVTTLTSTGA